MVAPKMPKPPPPPPPVATPDVSSPQAADDEMKRVRRQNGYSQQTLVGNLTPNTGKKTLLG